MKLISTIFLSFILSNIFAQCKDSVLIKPWGEWNELQFNSTVYRIEHRNNDSLLSPKKNSKADFALFSSYGFKMKLK